VKSPTGAWKYNPSDNTPLPPGTGLIFMGSPQARGEIEVAAGVPSP
jgi:hypothetical protein